MITRDLREAIARAVAEEEPSAVAEAGEGPRADGDGARAGGTRAAKPDPGLRPGRKPGEYASSVAFSLGPGAAERIASRLKDAESWIETAEVTGRGFVTVTVTPEALHGVAERMTDAGPGCARSDALKGMTFLECPVRGAPGTPGARGAAGTPGAEAWVSAATWEEARRLVAAQATARLAEAAGAEIAGEDAGGGGGTETRWEEKGRGVPETVAFAGRDAVRFFLLRAVPGSKISVDARKIARHLPGNPAYAVRYAHARAASGMRWAAAADPAQAVPQWPSADPGEPALLDALSWLPERVATAARRGRPDEFARYLERVAEVTLDALTRPPGAKAPGSDRLAVARAARTGLAAGLELLGVNAPERLLPNRPEKINAMSELASESGSTVPRRMPPTSVSEEKS